MRIPQALLVFAVLSACRLAPGCEAPTGADLERIDELHETDMQASKEQDHQTRRSLMSDDAVLLPPGGRMIRGGPALDEAFAAAIASEPTVDVLEYRFDWQEIQVCGDHAFEWGYIIGEQRDRGTGAAASGVYHVMRILQRQVGGAWKVHRTIWNEAVR